MRPPVFVPFSNSAAAADTSSSLRLPIGSEVFPADQDQRGSRAFDSVYQRGCERLPYGQFGFVEEEHFETGVRECVELPVLSRTCGRGGRS